MSVKGKAKAAQYDWSLLAKRLLDFYQETLDRVNRPETGTTQKSAVSEKH